ncbi:hypothetical protein RvY_16966-2 [Ramazzottius varieornatus]|nr:hypothetical protein RvY_16966-2 [Ramazzottius varieornatus]
MLDPEESELTIDEEKENEEDNGQAKVAASDWSTSLPEKLLPSIARTKGRKVLLSKPANLNIYKLFFPELGARHKQIPQTLSVSPSVTGPTHNLTLRGALSSRSSLNTSITSSRSCLSSKKASQAKAVIKPSKSKLSIKTCSSKSSTNVHSNMDRYIDPLNDESVDEMDTAKMPHGERGLIFPYRRTAHPDLPEFDRLRSQENNPEPSFLLLSEPLAAPITIEDRRRILWSELERLTKPINRSFPQEVVYDQDKLLTAIFSDEDRWRAMSDETFEAELTHLNSTFFLKREGRLRFDSLFESGNLRKAIQVDHQEYDLCLAADIGRAIAGQWYYFQVSGMKARTAYRFNIINGNRPSCFYGKGMQPAVFSLKEARSVPLKASRMAAGGEAVVRLLATGITTAAAILAVESKRLLWASLRSASLWTFLSRTMWSMWPIITPIPGPICREGC